MTTLRINITKEVLEATKDCSALEPDVSKKCAVSFAVREIWPTARTGYEEIYISGSGTHINHNQQKFIYRFDRATPAERAAMQPFSFDIEVPDSVIGEVNIEEIRRICEGSKTLELVGEK